MGKQAVKKWQLNLRPRNIITHEFYLDELKKCSMYDQQIEYCLKSLHLIFSGSTRLVFEYDDKVIKLAKVAAGLIANYYEANQTKICPNLFPNVEYVHEAKKERYDFIISEKVVPFNYTLMQQKLGVSWQELFSLIIWFNIKDIKDSNIRQAWMENYRTRMLCSVAHVKELYEMHIKTNNPIKQFIDNTMQYVNTFDESLRPNVISDFTCRNMGWSEARKSIVILDNGADVHTNHIINKCLSKNRARKAIKLIEMIQDGKINSTMILSNKRK